MHSIVKGKRCDHNDQDNQRPNEPIKGGLVLHK